MQKLVELLRILRPAERRRFWLILAGITLVALGDVAGVASVIPFLGIVVNPASASKFWGVTELRTMTGIVDDRSFIIFVGIASMLIITTSNLLNAWVTAAQIRLANAIGVSLGRRLLSAYATQDQVTLLGRNSSELGKNILSEVDRTIVGVLVPAMTVISRAVAAGGIILFLVLIDPVIALSLAAIFGGIYIAVYFIAQRWLANIGMSAIDANKERFRIVNETFGALRELRLYGRVDAFVSRFDEPARVYSETTATSLIVGQIPRFVLEPLAFASIVFLVVHSIMTGGNPASVIPMAGMFAFAGYRLLPSLQHVFSGFASVRFYAPALATILQTLRSEKAVPAERASVAPAAPRFSRKLEFKKVGFSYPERPNVLVDINLSIAAETTVGLIGRTGSGKTTLISLLLGLLHPASGTILVDGVPLTGERLIAWQRKLGYVPQDVFLIDGSIAANIALGLFDDEINLAAVEKAARLANVHDFIANLPAGYKTVVGERGARLSGGQRQRIGIARALYHDPEVIVLDEATSGLDSETEQTFLQAIDQLAGQRTLIVVAHRPTTLRRADVVHMIDGGRIVASGSLEAVMPSIDSDRRLPLGSAAV